MQQPDISDAAHSGRHLTASAVVIDPARRVVLLAVHNVTRLWQFPGGHLEPDESGDEAAIREAREETGIHATLWTRDRLDVPAGVWQPSPIMTIQYVAPANPAGTNPNISTSTCSTSPPPTASSSPSLNPTKSTTRSGCRSTN
ncbi:NUDIX domain-containing protein [Phytohabitans flavus]|uniref:NUDIX domain-containing protein n=1 Tax=Phytohabitans flavus TaxID=1076124 RepID=UPI00362D9E5B